MAESVKIVRTVRRSAKSHRQMAQSRQDVALVPTMGALHAGHISLVRLAKKKADKAVVRSSSTRPSLRRTRIWRAIRVTKPATSKNSPRSTPISSGARAVEEMYPEGFSTGIDAGKRRGRPRRRLPPAPLRRRCDRLLQAVQPGYARYRDLRRKGLSAAHRAPADGPRSRYATETDRRADQREKDGLALSSRNAYLSRSRAPDRARALRRDFRASPESCIRHVVRDGDVRRNGEACRPPALDVDYVEVRDAETLVEAAQRLADRPLRVLAAAWLGKTRLIDNVAV